MIFRAEVAFLNTVSLFIDYDTAERTAQNAGIAADALVFVAYHNAFGSYRQRTRDTTLNARFSFAVTALNGKVHFAAFLDLNTRNRLFSAFVYIYSFHIYAPLFTRVLYSENIKLFL